MYALKIGLFQGIFAPHFPFLNNDENGRNILPPTLEEISTQNEPFNSNSNSMSSSVNQ